MQGLEAALWRALMCRWLDPTATIPAPVLDWLVHPIPPAHAGAGIDIAWPARPY